MKRCVPPLFSALTGLFPVCSRGALAAGTGLLLGCAAPGADRLIAAPPVPERLAPCPAPGLPALPSLRPDLSLDSPENLAALMERDDLLRQTLAAAWDSLRCCGALFPESAGAPDDALPAGPRPGPEARPEADRAGGAS